MGIKAGEDASGAVPSSSCAPHQLLPAQAAAPQAGLHPTCTAKPHQRQSWPYPYRAPAKTRSFLGQGVTLQARVEHHVLSAAAGLQEGAASEQNLQGLEAILVLHTWV